MTSLASYTPLESLLLFHALQTKGVTSIPFNDISDELQSVPLIRNDPSFDRVRLEPAALKDLYLGLLKEEARQDVEQADETTRSPNPRKRRAPTPSLPTVDEAAKHAHLIPKLILRLYARYRAKVVEAIKSEERRYDALTQEISELEEAQREEELRKEQASSAANVPLPPVEPVLAVSQSTAPAHRPILPLPDQNQARASPTPVGTPQLQSVGTPKVHSVGTPKLQSVETPGAQSVATSRAPSIGPPGAPSVASSRAPSVDVAGNRDGQVERPNHAQIEAVINQKPSTARASLSPRPAQAPSAMALPPLSEMAPESPAPHRPPSQQPHTPQLPPSAQAAQGYRASPPIGHQPQFPPPFPRPSTQGPSPSPKLQPTMAQPSPSTSPRPVLPLPPGMRVAPQSPNIQNGAANHRPPAPIQPHPAQQYASPTQRIPPVPLQPADRNTPRHFPLSHLPSHPAHPQPYPQYQASGPQPYPAPQPPPPHQPYPARSHQGPPHQGGVQLPPFQVGPQEPSRPPPQSVAPHAHVQPLRPAPAQIQQHAFPPHSPYGQAASQPMPQHDQARMVSSIIEALRKAPWATWKAARPSHLPHPDSDLKESPAPEPLSPVVNRHTSPQQKLRQASPPKEQEAGDVPEDAMLAPKDSKTGLASSKSAKPTRKSTRQSRAGSTASSAVTGSVRARTRSQSVVSHTESQPGRSEASASVRHVKDEPTTPAEFLHQEILTAPVETPTTGRSSRHRRGTVQTQAQSQPTSKRKRQRSPSPILDEGEAIPTYLAPRNDVVAASRNFQRLSAVIMNDISTHRHAGPFQKPVREKDAEGYGDIIKRPQDLKSIKAAITAGNRTVAAAAAKDLATDSPSATPGGSSSKEGGLIMLEKTADLVPPRAIVNSSQLEKEVMRMFANAVMFNPGEGGMVQDAREMADDIEAKVRDWRSAERQVEGRDEDDELGVAGPGPGKRRKL